jgi:hypothetical protein
MIVPWPWARPSVETWDLSLWKTVWWRTVRRVAARFAALVRAVPGPLLGGLHP